MAPEQIEHLKKLVAALAEWQLCMSYNDSYFGEPAGLVKRTSRELTKLLESVERTTSPVSQMTDEMRSALMFNAELFESHGFINQAKHLRDILAAAAPHAQAVEPVADPRPLFDRKLADLQQRGYEVIGRILHKDGEYALFDSSCRWLTQPQYWRLMHEQDGSLFATPAAPAPYPTRECAAEALTPTVGAPAAPAAEPGIPEADAVFADYPNGTRYLVLEPNELDPDLCEQHGGPPKYTRLYTMRKIAGVRRGEPAGTSRPETSHPAAQPQAVAEQGELPKWIDDQKGKDPLMDDMIHYIEQLRAAIAAGNRVPLSADGKSVWIEGRGEVALTDQQAAEPVALNRWQKEALKKAMLALWNHSESDPLCARAVKSIAKHFPEAK